jgi:hypothetical protein
VTTINLPFFTYCNIQQDTLRENDILVADLPSGLSLTLPQERKESQSYYINIRTSTLSLAVKSFAIVSNLGGLIFNS